MNKTYDITYFRFNENSVLLKWPQQITDSILEDIIFKTNLLKDHLRDDIVDVIPAFASLMVIFKTEASIENIKRIIENEDSNQVDIVPNSWHIPVCYDYEYALDINNFDLSYEQIIKTHTSSIYRVFMMGFLPGFIYCGGLHHSLHLKRKASPSRKIPKGSIAIGGQQTGIYPIDSPGGWHVIGRTPLVLFNPDKKLPTKVKLGDYITFYQISKKEFKKLI